MGFAEPALLWLLLVPIGIAVAYAVMQARRTRYAVRLTTLDLLDEVAPDRPGWKRHAPATAFLLALLVLTLALAKPTRPERVPVEVATVIVAFDTSISMDASDVVPRRIEVAQAAAYRFLEQVPDQVRVGLVEFAETAIPLIPPTTDHEEVRRAVSNLQLRPGTAIGDALVASVDMIERDFAQLEDAGEVSADALPPATIVLLSDGDTTAGRPNEVGIRAAQEAGLPVSTISFGTRSGVIVFQGEVVPVPVNGAALRHIAEETGGAFFDAVNADELSQVFESLGSRVGFETQEIEITGRFVAVAFVLALLAGVASLFWFSRLP